MTVEWFLTTVEAKFFELSLTLDTQLRSYLFVSLGSIVFLLVVGAIIGHFLGSGAWREVFSIITSLMLFSTTFMISGLIGDVLFFGDFWMIVKVFCYSIIPWIVMITGIIILYRITSSSFVSVCVT